MAKKDITKRTKAQIAGELAAILGKNKRVVEVGVNRWLSGKSVPSREALIAIYKCGYPLEPFIFGVERWEELKKGRANVR